jgi:plastocyanin
MGMPKPVLVLLAGAAVMGAVLAVTLSSGAETAREIVLEVRGMAFYANGAGTPNPRIHARPGELVRVTLRNGDAGLVHDFAVSDLGVSVQPLQTGASGSVVFRVPRAPGIYDYVCQPHARMMRGQLDVGPDLAADTNRASR